MPPRNWASIFLYNQLLSVGRHSADGGKKTRLGRREKLFAAKAILLQVIGTAFLSFHLSVRSPQATPGVSAPSLKPYSSRGVNDAVFCGNPAGFCSSSAHGQRVELSPRSSAPRDSIQTPPRRFRGIERPCFPSQVGGSASTSARAGQFAV